MAVNAREDVHSKQAQHLFNWFTGLLAYASHRVERRADGFCEYKSLALESYFLVSAFCRNAEPKKCMVVQNDHDDR